MDRGLVSVVITAWNVGRYIKECLDSVLGQEYNNLEVVVVEDCSTDNTLEVIRSYDDSRVKLIVNQENVGAGMSRRIGINASTGDWVITVDGDDYLSANFIGDLVEAADKTGADIVNGGITSFVDGMKKSAKGYTFEDKVVEGFDKFKSHQEEDIRFLNNKLVRRTLYDKVEYCGRRFIEDTPTLYKLLWYANKVAYINNYGYWYRQRSYSLIHYTSDADKEKYLMEAVKDIKDFFKDKEGGERVLEELRILEK